MESFCGSKSIPLEEHDTSLFEVWNFPYVILLFCGHPLNETKTNCVTLSSPRDISSAFPSFIFKSEAEMWEQSFLSLVWRCFCLTPRIRCLIAVKGGKEKYNLNRQGQHHCIIISATIPRRLDCIFCMLERIFIGMLIRNS